MIQSELANQVFGDMSLFDKEIDMYTKIVPQIEDIFRESGTVVSIGPKCVKTQKNPPAIVLEDLKVHHYENIDRLNGMDQKHVEATLDRLAQFHAATARIYQRRGAFADYFHQPMFPPEFEGMMQTMADNNWPLMEECIREWGDSEQYLEKIKKINSQLFRLMTESETVDRTDFNVLNHGDMWANNTMFQHNEDGSIRDVKLVDLQISRWGSPVQDLQYFLITSCNYDIRIEKFDYFIKYYHDQLIRNLKLVKYSGELPTLVQLQRDVLRHGYFSVGTAIGVLTVVLLDPNENADMENFMVESEKGIEFKRQVYSNPRYVKAMKALLPFFDSRGLLDV